MNNAFNYIAKRFEEKGTWLAIGAAIPTAVSLPWPWSAASVLVAAIVAMFPTP